MATSPPSVSRTTRRCDCERAIRLGASLIARGRDANDARRERRGEDETRVSARARNDLVVLIDPND